MLNDFMIFVAPFLVMIGAIGLTFWIAFRNKAD